jgi:hypothetical protein
MDSWHLTKLLAAGTVAFSHGETGWSLVDETGRTSRGPSLEEVILRASRPRRRRPGAKNDQS